MSDSTNKPQPLADSDAPNDETEIRYQREMRQFCEQERKISRKKIEEVLTAKQLREYKNRVFPSLAFQLLHEAKVLTAIDATTEEKRRLERIDELWRAKAHEIAAAVHASARRPPTISLSRHS